VQFGLGKWTDFKAIEKDGDAFRGIARCRTTFSDTILPTLPLLESTNWISRESSGNRLRPPRRLWAVWQLQPEVVQTVQHVSCICTRWTFDYIWLNVHYCLLFSSRVRVRIRVRIRCSVWLVSCYAHVFVRLQFVLIVTDPWPPSVGLIGRNVKSGAFRVGRSKCEVMHNLLHPGRRGWGRVLPPPPRHSRKPQNSLRKIAAAAVAVAALLCFEVRVESGLRLIVLVDAAVGRSARNNKQPPQSKSTSRLTDQPCWAPDCGFRQLCVKVSCATEEMANWSGV